MSTKNRILQLLENSRGKTVSGAVIAAQLGVTRNAVWKAIQALEKDGYKIEASTKTGYCLCDTNDILSAQGMSPFLWGRQAQITVHSALESTNKTAKALAIAGAAHGTIIVADHQTAGQGRYGRSFFSPPGHGIYISFILRPANNSHAPTMFTTYAAVCVCEAIEALTGKHPQIKWVNDIFIGDKKICGILTEAVTDFESGHIQWVVVGIGINFSTPAGGFPKEIRHVAGAVFDRDMPTTTRNRLAAEVANRMMDFENRCGTEAVLGEYRKRLMMLGKKVLITGIKTPYEAIALDIDQVGRLLVKTQDGQVLPLSSGEVSIKTTSQTTNYVSNLN